MSEKSFCPAVSHSGLTCMKSDEYTPHQTLSHRSLEGELEWPIDNSDRLRWGMVQEKRKKVVASVPEETDVTTEDPMSEETE